MTTKTLEQEAREAAVDSGLDNYKHRRHDFANGYLAAATARDKEIEELRAELAKVTEQRDAWPKYYGRATEGLMVLHDRKDLQDLSGLRCGDFMANAVPRLVEEIDRLRARVKELEGMVPKWVGDAEHSRLLALGWRCGPEVIWHRASGMIEAEWHWLMVPPIPLPEGE